MRFVRRPSVDNQVKVGTFPIKRARVRKGIGSWSGHVPINLALPAGFMLKTAVKRFTRAKGIAWTRDSAGIRGAPYDNPNRIIPRRVVNDFAREERERAFNTIFPVSAIQSRACIVT